MITIIIIFTTATTTIITTIIVIIIDQNGYGRLIGLTGCRLKGADLLHTGTEMD